MDDSELLSFLQDLVRLESTPGREERVVLRAVEEMRRLGFAEALVDAAGNGVGRIGQGGPSVLIDCHIDTIPLRDPERWLHPPLAAEVADGRVYGLGVCDMKASAAAAIYGAARIAELRRDRPGTLWITCSIAEEMMEGAALAETVDRCAPDFVVIGEPTDLRLCIGQRGRAKLEVQVSGASSHAGHPEIGINAVERMAEYIGAAAALEHPIDPVLGPRLLTCIDVHSEPYPSISTVPATCLARFDCRFGRGESEQSLLELMSSLGAVWSGTPRPPELDCHLYLAEWEAYNGRRYIVPEFAAAWYTDPGSPSVRAALAGLEDAGLPALTATYGFCTNGSLTAGLRGIPTIGYGVGREEEAHVVDEYVSLDNLFRAAKGYSAIAERLLDLAPSDVIGSGG